ALIPTRTNKGSATAFTENWRLVEERFVRLQPSIGCGLAWIRGPRFGSSGARMPLRLADHLLLVSCVY
ncbi:hypothetical protein KKG90_08185, partial [Candidatus Bipolaricaulota bacterium]|nr:hypothetical protein [Candidatus Bipolaricaulota bacterium]